MVAVCSSPVVCMVDDSAKIIQSIRNSSKQGVITIEQHSGKLLSNPSINSLQNRSLNNKFFVPAMIVNQKKGLQLVNEFPLVCLLMSAYELKKPKYKDYRQHKVLMHIQQQQNFPASRVMICELQNFPTMVWRKSLKIQDHNNPFRFEISKSYEGESFYYYLNDLGYFDMYFSS